MNGVEVMSAERWGVSSLKELDEQMMLSGEILRVLAGDHPWCSGMPSHAFQAGA